MIWIVLVATLLPLLGYLTIGLSRASKARTVEDYFVYGQTVTAQEYANTSIGYALQMAAIFLFVDWGIRYGIGALWTPLFWMLGFLLLYFTLPWFAEFYTTRSTLHSYLRDKYSSRVLQVCAAFATIIGLWGTMMAELDYTVQLYTPIVSMFSPIRNADVSLFCLVCFFLLFGTLYIMRNGYKAEVRTEQVQVPVAYTCIIGVVLLLLPSVWLHGGVPAFLIVALFLSSIFILMLIAKFLMNRAHIFKDRQTWIPVAGVCCVVVLFFALRATIPTTGNINILSQPLGDQIKAQGLVGVISLAFANVLWMIVDISTWQRVASVGSETPGTFPLDALRRGTARVAIESPASWCFGIALGWAISGAGLLKPGTDPSEAVAKLAGALVAGRIDPLPGWCATFLVYPIFLVASLSIALSTVNPIVSAVSFTAYYDLGRVTTAQEPLRQARKWTGAIVLVGLGLYPLIKYALGNSLPTFLYTTYSAQLALFPIASLALIGKNLQTRAALASLAAGLVCTALGAFVATEMNAAAWSVLPPVYAVVGSFIGYVLFYNPRLGTEGA